MLTEEKRKPGVLVSCSHKVHRNQMEITAKPYADFKNPM
jgi:hypothetical protein